MWVQLVQLQPDVPGEVVLLLVVPGTPYSSTRLWYRTPWYSEHSRTQCSSTVAKVPCTLLVNEFFHPGATGTPVALYGPTVWSTPSTPLPST